MNAKLVVSDCHCCDNKKIPCISVTVGNACWECAREEYKQMTTYRPSPLTKK